MDGLGVEEVEAAGKHRPGSDTLPYFIQALRADE